MSEKLSHNSTKAAQRQERAELTDEVKDLVNVDSYGRAHVPTGSGKASGNFLSNHEIEMIGAHKGQIEGGLEARNADYIINQLISHNGENELTDPQEIRDALVVGLDDLNFDDYDDEEIMQFVADKRRELAEYNGELVAEKETPSTAEADTSNPEVEQLKTENAELRAELAEMRKAIAELTAALKGGASAQAKQGFDVNTEVEAAKARLSQEAEEKAQAAIDAIHSTDQAKADKALLDDGKKSETAPNGELRLDEHGQAELNRILADEDQTSGSRAAQVTGDTFHTSTAEQTDNVPSSVVERMAAVRAATGNTENGATSAQSWVAARMDAIANASTGTSESASSSSRGVRARDWLRHPLASASERAVNARSGVRAEREGNNNRNRRKKLLAGFVLFGGAIGGGLLLMKGHDIFSYSIGGNGGNGGLDGIKDIPTDGPGKKTGGGNGGNEILTSVRVKPGDGEIKVTQSILEQQGIHVNTTDAQRIGEHANVDLLLRDNNYNDTSSTLDRIGAGPGTYDIRPGSAEALVKSARELGFRR